MTESNIQTLKLSLLSIRHGLVEIFKVLEDEGVDLGNLSQGFEEDIARIRECEKRFNK